MNVSRIVLFACLLILGTVATSVNATTKYVDINAASTPHDGSDWAHGYLNLQCALDAARADSSITEIRVADGVYKPTPLCDGSNGTNQAISFELVDNVKLRGGFRGGSTSPDTQNFMLYTTYLSGDIDNDEANPPNQPCPTVDAQNSEHVVRATDITHVTSDATLFEGFTVTSGARCWGPGCELTGSEQYQALDDKLDEMGLSIENLMH
jgi:hypothetical protein